ncbi:DUF1317 family protein [Mixta calida]|uniref:DUF1317 family protein n=1 Tax=Mixta calida TaxID=665913 RepID=UPI0011A1AB6C|nr:DUF1317 family protein [Mixta calida]MDU5747801.1 DUF1317 family protein [Haemophilus parainfluenzae]DAV72736.1 MAG TPA: Protein of unknown function (DUF1317) [Caudoviricetes sp.]
MKQPTDAIRVGRIALPYSRKERGWVTPTGKVIRNPIRAQRAAELINDRLPPSYR